MQVKSVVLGVLAGFVLGWITFGALGKDEARSSDPVSTTGPDARAAVLKGRAPSPSASDLTKGQGGASSPNARTPGAEDGEGGERALSSAEVEALVARLPKSRSEGDWRAFAKALRSLADARTPAAQQALMDVLLNLSIVFPKKVGRVFHEGLEHSELEGIADAARLRFEQQIASGKTSWVAADGWVDLVADHGDEADIAWLVAHTDSRQIRSSVQRALGKSQNPVAMQYMLRRFREHNSGAPHSRELIAFVKSHPQEGFDLVVELIRLALANRLSPHLDRRSVIRCSTVAVPASRLSEARELLLELRTEGDRVAAVYAVQALHDRGLGMEGLEGIVLAPQEALAMMSEHDGADLGAFRTLLSNRAYEATTAIQANSITWSDEAVRVLEAAAARLEGSSAQGHVKYMKDMAAKLRTGLASPWRK